MRAHSHPAFIAYSVTQMPILGVRFVFLFLCTCAKIDRRWVHTVGSVTSVAAAGDKTPAAKRAVCASGNALKAWLTIESSTSRRAVFVSSPVSSGVWSTVRYVCLRLRRRKTLRCAWCVNMLTFMACTHSTTPINNDVCRALKKCAHTHSNDSFTIFGLPPSLYAPSTDANPFTYHIFNATRVRFISRHLRL